MRHTVFYFILFIMKIVHKVQKNKKGRKLKLIRTEACPTNSSVRQSLQFTFNSKIFGAMSSDSFVMDCNFFSLKPVEDLICARQNRFVTRYIYRQGTVYVA